MSKKARNSYLIAMASAPLLFIGLVMRFQNYQSGSAAAIAADALFFAGIAWLGLFSMRGSFLLARELR